LSEWWLKVDMGKGDEWNKIKDGESSEWKKQTLAECDDLEKVYKEGMEPWLQCAKCDAIIAENDEPCQNCGVYEEND